MDKLRAGLVTFILVGSIASALMIVQVAKIERLNVHHETTLLGVPTQQPHPSRLVAELVLARKQAEQVHPQTVPKDALTCLADNLYYESANEPYEGQLAVAQVVLNRLAEGIYGHTICDVIYFKAINPNNGKKQAAFSWTLGSKWRAKYKAREAYDACVELARDVLQKHLRSDIIDESVAYYHANYIRPTWADEHEMVARIGQHIFYR